LAGPWPFIQQRISDAYRRQRAAPLPSRAAKSRHQSQLGVDGLDVAHGAAQHQPLGAKLLAERRQAVAVAVYRSDSLAIGMLEPGSLTAHATARASDEDRFHLARLDHIFNAIERDGHVTDVVALTQPAAEHPVIHRGE